MSKRQMWVLEMRLTKGRKWLPTNAAALTRSELYSEKKLWEAENPHDKFRVTKYIPYEPYEMN